MIPHVAFVHHTAAGHDCLLGQQSTLGLLLASQLQVGCRHLYGLDPLAGGLSRNLVLIDPDVTAAQFSQSLRRTDCRR